MEMKKAWTRPLTTVQQFDANEAISACGDSGTNYLFKCNAGSKWKQYDVYRTGVKDQVTGGTLLTQDEEGFLGWGGSISYYHPCDSTHETNGLNDFDYGYIVDNGGYDGTNGAKTAVVIWTEGGTDIHCTTNLNMSTWATAKS